MSVVINLKFFSSDSESETKWMKFADEEEERVESIS